MQINPAGLLLGTKRAGTAALLSALVLTLSSAPAGAAYPTNVCVAKKMVTAGKYCQARLKAWSKWQKAPAAAGADQKRDDSIARATTKFSQLWDKADQVAAKKGVDCSDTTYTGTEALAALDAAVDVLQTSVADGLNAGDKYDLRCRSKILNAAASLCSGELKAQGKHVKALAKDPDRTRVGAATAKATAKFSSKVAREVAKAAARGASCDNSPGFAAMGDDLAAMTAAVVDGTTVSPNVSTAWTMVTPDTEIPYRASYPGALKTLRPICAHGTPYNFFVRRGSVNKLVVYYQGGGACWDGATCHLLGTFKQSTGSGDDPTAYPYGLNDYDRPENPFRDWNAVVIGYCTGDVHWGDGGSSYGQSLIRHKGRHNASVVEKWAREHFVNPERVFVTGSSAGSYGAIFNSVPLIEAVYPASTFDVLGDGGMGVITPDFMGQYMPNWGIEATRPTHIPGLGGPLADLSIIDAWASIANYFPGHRFGQYTTAYDGGDGSQLSFYQVMLNPGDVLEWPKWWEPTCDWNAQVRQICQDTGTQATNFRCYIGAGSRHTMFGSDKVYTDTSGGVPTVVDWMNAMLAGDPAWTDVECSDCNPIATCQGGSSRGLACAVDSDCPGGSCDQDPIGSGAPFQADGTVVCP